MIFNTKVIPKFVLSLALFAGLSATAFIQKAEAARSCRVAAQGDRPGEVVLHKIRGSESLAMKAATYTKVKALFSEHGVELSSKKITEALVAMGEHIRNGSSEPSLVKSEKTAKILNKFYDLAEGDLTKDQKLMFGYLVGETVLKMERMQLKKFKKTDTPEVFSQSGALHIKDFHKMVESYIDGTALYRNLGSDVGFIEWPDIRHLYSNNSWGIGLRDHDAYHLHYAYGHPYYLAINFMSSRGINDRRYAMISAFWEAVDTNQTGFESKMSAFFQAKNMTPQEGMIYLARATKEMLDEVEGIDSQTVNNAYSYERNAVDVARNYNIGVNSGWVPRLVKFGRTSAPEDMGVYDKEIEKFINKSLQLRADTANKRYYNYHREGPGKTSATDEDRSY